MLKKLSLLLLLTTLTTTQALAGLSPDPILNGAAKDASVNSPSGARKIQDSAGNPITVGQKTKAASWPMTMASDQGPISVSPAAPSDVMVTGTLTAACATGVGCAAGSTVAVNTQGASTVGLNITGTFVETIVFDCLSADGTTWQLGLSGYPIAGGTGAASVTAPSSLIFPVGGCAQLRARASAFTSGSASVAQEASAGQGVVNVVQSNASALQSTSTQGPAGLPAGKWFVQHTDGTNLTPAADAPARARFHKVTDGTNTQAVKAASTAAVAADAAAVVTLSPNGFGQQPMANSQSVVVASNQTSIPVSSTPYSAATASITSVANAVTSSTVLASNAARKGAIIFNDPSGGAGTNCDIAFAATATTSAFTIRVSNNQTYIMDATPIYTGAISSICDAALGNLRVTEL